MRKRSGPPFEGFQGPNYTMVPNELFDRLMPELAGAELKVLLYVVRRTFGFKKDADAISLSQMLRGIRTRDGRVLDRGVGLAKNTLLGALASLEARNVILIERRQSAERGNEPNVYRLNVVGVYPAPIAETPPAQKEDQGAGGAPAPSVQKEDRGVGAKTAPPPEREVRQGPGPPAEPSPWRENRYPQEKEQQERSRQDESSQNTGGQPKAQSNASNGRAPDRPGASLSPDDGPAPSARRRVYDPERRLILEYMADFARELSDQASLVSTTSRAVNLFRRSERTIEEFTEALLQARSITKERAQTIRAERRDPASALAVRPKMAFFFAVLEDLLGLRPPDRPLPADDATPTDEPTPARAGWSEARPAAPDGAGVPVEPSDGRSSGLLSAPGPRQAWEIAQEELRRSLSGASFETWVRQARAVSHRRRTFTVAVPNAFAREWLETRLRRPVEEALGRVLGEPTVLAVVVDRPGERDGAGEPVPSRPRGRRPRARGAPARGAGGASGPDGGL